MTKDEAKRLVVLGTAATATITVVGSLKEEKIPPASVGIGSVAAGIGLAVMAEFWPNGAGTFAMLMATTAALAFGKPAWEGLQTAVKPKAAKVTAGAAATGATLGAVVGAEVNRAPAATPSNRQPNFGVPGQ